MTMVNSFPQKMNLSFSGCGFLCIYHAGVAAAIKEFAPQLTQNKISGASAGAIVAAGLVCNVCISHITNAVLAVVSQARSHSVGPLHPAFNLLGIVREHLRATLPPDAYELCSNRLQISLTRWSDSKNVLVNQYSSNEDLIDAILCSCFIPVYCGLCPPTYRGVQYIDGGFTDNQPAYDDHAVSVSPFAGESDICPPDWDSASFFGINFSNTSIRFTTRNLFRLTACLMPPNAEDCSKMCLQGFEDALLFLFKNGMAPCINCLTIQTDLNQPITGVVTIPADGRRGLSPQDAANVRNRLRSLNAKQKESECEACCEGGAEPMSHRQIRELFPPIVKKTFEEAIAAEDSVYKYIKSFRLFRYARIAFGIGKLPWDVLVIFAKNTVSWTASVVIPQWVRDRLKMIVDFVLNEAEHQKMRYNRFTCISLTESDYQTAHHQAVQKEKAFELSPEALHELATLQERDRRRTTPKHVETPDTGPNVELEFMTGDDTDSLDDVVKFIQHRDAMYAFHYMDDNNQMRSIELFNLSNSAKPHPCHSSRSSRMPSRQNSRCSSPQPRPASMVIHEEQVEEEVQQPSCSYDPEKDSGVSGLDQSHSNSRKDAGCSPVRHFPTRQPSGRSKPTTKRHGSFSSNHSNSGRRHHVTNVKEVSLPAPSPRDNNVSSDSEVDAGDRLFIPHRRERRLSNEYDGEPEPSDTDAAC